ncbi:MAG: 4Fe-4S binding protein [Candidatus Omnitrophica bacterium]|nr:4Fe-4S binding protein [Candidatus Omnitrophota bacterium]
MKHKKIQLVMMWFLPIIVIGGLFFPVLGYLVIGMMAFFLPLAFFKGRYWCWNLCPRGSFLDIVMSRCSSGKALPVFILKGWGRIVVLSLALFMSILIFSIIKKGGNFLIIGAIFVAICLGTTIVSIILALLTRHRSWCAICPMGKAQSRISKLNKKNR